MKTLLSEFFASSALYIKLSISDFSFTQNIENFSQKIGEKGFSDVVSLILVDFSAFLHVLDTITITNKLY